jgi:N-acetylglucosamine-6-sulfatase
VGKILNELTIENWQSPPLKGWTGTDLLLDPWAYDFMRPAFGRNDQPWFRYNNSYTTDLVAQKSLGFLDDALESDKPFFLGVAPIAPHSEVLVDIQAQTVAQFRPRPAKRHEGRFAGVQVPRGANFNPDVPSGAGWIKELEKLTETEVLYGDDWHVGRLESLLAVDEMIEALFTKLENANVLDNTYVIFTSDNGFHISQHRLFPGKTCGFEEDINIPFYVRGPGVAEGATLNVVSGHIDVAPTILSMAGIPMRDNFDGRPIPLNSRATCAGGRPKVEHVNVEMYRDTNAHSFMNGTADRQTVNFTYTSVRLLSDEYNMYYSVWCTGEHELYDLNVSQYIRFPFGKAK